MTPKLLRKIKSLVKAGATVFGPPPVQSPSLEHFPHCDAEVKKLARERAKAIIRAYGYEV